MGELLAHWEDANHGSHAWYNSDGTAKWSATRGPIGAAILTIDRIGWSPISATKWKDDRGIEIDLTLYSPKLFDILVRDSCQRLAERSLAKKTADPLLVNRSACLDPARDYIKKRKHSTKAKSAVAAVVTNSLWTKSRLRESGYQLDDVLCDLCGVATDTLHHRLWICNHPQAVCARNRIAGTRLVAEAVTAGDQSTFFCHGILPHPCDLLPLPSLSGTVSSAVVTEHLDVDEVQAVSGNVFADGHATKTGIKGMDRASWAVVEVDENTKEHKVFISPVWGWFPQTSQAAEYLAGVYTAMLATWNTTLYDDCQGVVDYFCKERNQWDNERHAYSGLMRQVIVADPNSNLQEIIKVEAHVDIFEDMDGDDEFKAQGNHLADQWADKAEKLHPQPPKELLEAVNADIAKVRSVIDVIGELIPLWPYTSNKAKRRPKVLKTIKQHRVGIVHRHKWQKGASRWRCGICRASTRGLTLPAHRKKQRCHGALDRLTADVEDHLDHGLVEFNSQDGNFTICRKCGAWGMKRAIKLAACCDGEPNTLRTCQAWQRVFVEGRHPYTGKSFRSAVDGVCDVTTSIGWRNRTTVKNIAKQRRLSGKTKPWAAALLGTFTDGPTRQLGPDSDGGVDQLFNVDVDYDPFNTVEPEATPAVTVFAPLVTEAQRLSIAEKRDAAILRKRMRSAVTASQKRAIAVKRLKAIQARCEKHGFGALTEKQLQELREALVEPTSSSSDGVVSLVCCDEPMGGSLEGSTSNSEARLQELPAGMLDQWLEDSMDTDDKESSAAEESLDSGQELPAGTLEQWLEDSMDTDDKETTAANASEAVDLPAGTLERWLEEVMDTSCAEGEADRLGQFHAACVRRSTGPQLAQSPQSSEADELFGDFPDPSEDCTLEEVGGNRVRGRKRAFVEDWELEGVDPAYFSAGQPMEVEEPPEHKDAGGAPVHCSWCVISGCDGNCCTNTAEASQRDGLRAVRAGERQRQAHNKAAAAAATKPRVIVEGADGRELNPAQKTMARLLAKVRRTDQQ